MSQPFQSDQTQQYRLDSRAIALWRYSGLIPTAILTAIAVAGGIGAHAIWGWSLAFVFLPAIAILAVGVVCSLVIPPLLYDRWHWRITDDEVDTTSGVLVITHRLIPMARIQHVDTTRGVLERAMGLATVVVHTAAGSSNIPVLSVEQANAVRDQIAAMSNTYEDL